MRTVHADLATGVATGAAVGMVAQVVLLAVLAGTVGLGAPGGSSASPTA